MAKSNEFVGVDEQYLPEDAQQKTYVQEPVIGSENAEKVRGVVSDATNYIASDEGQEKIKSGARKGLKVAKGIGIGYIVFFCVVMIAVIAVFVVVIINMSNMQKENDRLHREVDEASKTIQREQEEMQKQYDEQEKAIKNAQDQYNEAVDGAKEQYDEATKNVKETINESTKKAKDAVDELFNGSTNQ